MKTPRELLLERHRPAEAKLDRIRRDVLAAQHRPEAATATPLPALLRGFLWEFRRQFAVMSAAWLVAVILNLDANPSAAPVVATAANHRPLTEVAIAICRDNRRQLLEMISAREAESPKAIAPRPRSQRRFETLIG